MKFIAFGHRKRTGKDTVAIALLKELEIILGKGKVKKVAFADPLYELCHKLYAWDGFATKSDYDEGLADKEAVLPTIGKSPRQILIDMGTPAIRNNVYEGTWIDYALKSDHGSAQVALITDMRFPNEYYAIKDAGGICVRIDRPSITPTDDLADSALATMSDDSWDAIIINDGSVQKLLYNAAKVAEEYLHLKVLS